MEISRALTRVYAGFDYVPIVSTVSNALTLIFQNTACRCLSRSTIASSHFWTYIESKDPSRCKILLIPFIGNIYLFWIDFIKSTPAKVAAPVAESPFVAAPAANSVRVDSLAPDAPTVHQPEKPKVYPRQGTRVFQGNWIDILVNPLILQAPGGKSPITIRFRMGVGYTYCEIEITYENSTRTPIFPGGGDLSQRKLSVHINPANSTFDFEITENQPDFIVLRTSMDYRPTKHYYIQYGTGFVIEDGWGISTHHCSVYDYPPTPCSDTELAAIKEQALTKMKGLDLLVYQPYQGVMLGIDFQKIAYGASTPASAVHPNRDFRLLSQAIENTHLYFPKKGSQDVAFRSNRLFTFAFEATPAFSVMINGYPSMILYERASAVSQWMKDHTSLDANTAGLVAEYAASVTVEKLQKLVQQGKFYDWFLGNENALWKEKQRLQNEERLSHFAKEMIAQWDTAKASLPTIGCPLVHPTNEQTTVIDPLDLVAEYLRFDSIEKLEEFQEAEREKRKKLIVFDSMLNILKFKASGLKLDPPPSSLQNLIKSHEDLDGKAFQKAWDACKKEMDDFSNFRRDLSNEQPDEFNSFLPQSFVVKGKKMKTKNAWKLIVDYAMPATIEEFHAIQALSQPQSVTGETDPSAPVPLLPSA